MSKALWARERLLHIDWETMGRLLTDLAEEIRGKGFRPDVVVGIARGGLPPAVALSNLLDIPEFAILGIPRNSSNSRYSDRAEPRYEYLAPERPLTGLRVLLVDDIMGDGGTMALAKELMRARGAAEIRTAVVVRNVNCASAPDHHAVSVDDWTVFPWEAPPGPEEEVVELGARW
jgi:hypoxanthine phosphoribosyltransferase